MDIKQIEFAYLPLVKVIRDELIAALSLKSLEDIKKHKYDQKNQGYIFSLAFYCH